MYLSGLNIVVYMCKDTLCVTYEGFKHVILLGRLLSSAFRSSTSLVEVRVLGDNDPWWSWDNPFRFKAAQKGCNGLTWIDPAFGIMNGYES